MRKLTYVNTNGLETGSWETAKTWGTYSIRLDEMPEQISEKERKRRKNRCAKIAARNKSRNV